jgi:hypothetical protein
MWKISSAQRDPEGLDLVPCNNMELMAYKGPCWGNIEALSFDDAITIIITSLQSLILCHTSSSSRMMTLFNFCDSPH